MDEVDALVERACEQLREQPAFAALSTDVPKVDAEALQSLRRAADRVLVALLEPPPAPRRGRRS